MYRFGTSTPLIVEFANFLARMRSSSIVSRLAGEISPVLVQERPAAADGCCKAAVKCIRDSGGGTLGCEMC